MRRHGSVVVQCTNCVVFPTGFILVQHTIPEVSYSKDPLFGLGFWVRVRVGIRLGLG